MFYGNRQEEGNNLIQTLPMATITNLKIGNLKEFFPMEIESKKRKKVDILG
ncbi:MAG: hypothetical protein IPG08_02250 [Sphingobacteriaceae bacterium]|nr:hypothetical protein [Sphingobacteriaceae bacterium]